MSIHDANVNTPGIALVCDNQLRIQNVIYNNLTGTEIDAETSFFQLLDTGSRKKAENFFIELKQEQAVFGWQLNLVSDTGLKVIYFSASLIDDKYVLIGVQSRDDFEPFFSELTKISSEHMVSMRILLKQLAAKGERPNTDSTANSTDPYDELSKLNNELIFFQRQIAKKNSEIERLYDNQNQELERARLLHQRFLPQQLPQKPDLSVAAYYQPATKLGGDYYNVVDLGGQLVFYLSDVTGHGIDGTLVTVFMKEVINSYLDVHFDQDIPLNTEDIMNHLVNRYHKEGFPEDYFICITIGVIDRASWTLTYSTVGMQVEPLLVEHNQKPVTLPCGGLPISHTVDKELLSLGTHEYQFTKPTTLIFTTDGIVEQFAADENYEDRLVQVFLDHSQAHPEEIVSAIKQDFSAFMGKQVPNDDISLLVIRVDPTNNEYP